MTQEYNRNKPQQAIEQLVEAAKTRRLLDHGNRSSKPGELIQNLGPIKRQILKGLTADDIKNVRWPR